MEELGKTIERNVKEFNHKLKKKLQEMSRSYMKPFEKNQTFTNAGM